MELQMVGDALGGAAVAVRVDGVRHAVVSGPVGQQSEQLPGNGLGAGAYQQGRPRGYPLGPLSGVPHHQDGLAQRWRLLL